MEEAKYEEMKEKVEKMKEKDTTPHTREDKMPYTTIRIALRYTTLKCSSVPLYRDWLRHCQLSTGQLKGDYIG